MCNRFMAIVAVLLLNSSFCVFAQSAGLTAISLEQALSLTVERNPDLVAFGHQLNVQRGRVRQSSLGPNPSLDLELENFAGTGALKRADGAATTVSLQWVLERGKRDGRTAVSNAELSLLQADASVRRVDEAAETAHIYLNCLEYQALLLQAEESVLLYKRLAGAAKKRVDSGRSPAADLARVEAALAEQNLGLDDYAHSLEVAVRRLAAQWGETNPSFSRVLGNAQSLPEFVDFAVLRERVAGNPSLSRFLVERRLRETEIRLAKLRAKPNWRVRAGLRHIERTGDQAFVAGITIPLSVRNKNQGRIAEKRAELSVSQAKQVAERIRVETELFAVYQELRHELHIATTYRDEILPRVQAALSETEQAYAAGRYSYLELRSAQDDALDARTNAITAAINAKRRVIEIERLTGTTIDGRGEG